MYLGTDTDSWSRARVLGEVTTYGDEWFECETMGKREHKITLLPTGSQAVPQTEPDWGYNIVKGR